MAAKKKLALIGANGMLGKMVQQVAASDWEICPLDLPDFDVTDTDAVNAVLAHLQPQLIINCAAFTDVDGCETQEPVATRINGAGAGNLALTAKTLDAILVHVSTDYVFSGSQTEPYLETDATGPQSAYGRSKLAGERAIIDSGLEKYFIIRTSWLYGPGGKNFVETIIRLAKEREDLGVIDDQVGTPTYTFDLAQAILSLAGSDAYGVYHYSNEGQCSWYGFAQEIVRLAEQAGEALKIETLRPIATEEYPLPATRPAYSVFSKGKFKAATGNDVPHWQTSLTRYMELRRN
ncbi:dTDP-4-dehydrorhamnose reductase [Malonomonas rubra]|uniref:dTDP-4-dehydrorhamnose reductase n=1 Tax=Malonomonas rubra TaxID=57040 RepID=UPI0026F114A1|nr:dTDP-4-dehydrorhamnose reductase [Malonomonas rubra]